MMDFTEDLIIALTVAMDEVRDETKRIIKDRIKEGLEAHLKEVEAEFKRAREFEKKCLQSDDDFSRETEEAMKDTEYWSYCKRRAEDLLEMLPPDRVIEVITTSGVHYQTIP